MHDRVRPVSIIVVLCVSMIAVLSMIRFIAAKAQHLARPAVTQTATVTWSNIIGATTHMQFATSDVVCDHPNEQYRDVRWCKDVASAKFGFIRLHDDIVDLWTTNQQWDRSKVSNALNCSYVKAIGGANTIICINKCPKWCQNSDGSVNQSEYAAFCASLVTMVNKKLGFGVHYWEPMNEPDFWPQYAPPSYKYKGTNALFPVFNACTAAMVTVDPSIVVGGPTCTFYNDWFIKQFLANCWSPHLGFVSWHDYDGDTGNTGTGNIIRGNQKTYNASTEYTDYLVHAREYGRFVTQCKADIAAARPSGDKHTVLVDNDEWNYCSYWHRGWMQQYNEGAAYDAAVLTSEIDAGIGISAVWCNKDDTYGLWGDLDSNDTIFAPAYLYTWANKYLVGQLAASTSSDADVTVLPVVGARDASGHTNYILLSNTAAGEKDVVLTHNMAYPQTAELDQITSSMGRSLPIGAPSMTKVPITGRTYTVKMSGFSVALLRLTGAHGAH